MMRVTIRMYEVGFGDCFLLGFHDEGRSQHILIDCGTITEKKDQLRRICDDVLSECGGRLALVVATHRHKDHVWGFDDSRWADVTVGEVWMPWTEDPDDSRATHVRERQSSLALALAGSPDNDNPLEVAPASESARRAFARSLHAMALNALTNEAAMRTLHEGFAGEPARKFLPERDKVCEARQVPGLDGVTFHILGPPRDEKALALMDPPEGVGYLKWPTRIPKRQVGSPFAAAYLIKDKTYLPPGLGTFQLDDKKDVRKAIEAPAGMLAAALDKAVNNTSLVIVIEAGGHHMLFTGDAQWGSWKAILAEPRSRALLEHVDVLKVGHHGSHNATPRELIEKLLDQDIIALFSTKPVKQWPNIPRSLLLLALGRRRARMARTDQLQAARAAGFRVEDDLFIEWDSAVARP